MTILLPDPVDFLPLDHGPVDLRPVETYPVPATAAGVGRRWWKRLRPLVYAAMLGLAVFELAQRSSDLQAAAARLTTSLEPRWILLAFIFEVASMVAFARLQQQLLESGGADVPMKTMVPLTLASNAISSTLPGGVAWAAAWGFGQLNKWGVQRYLRVWAFLAGGVLSSFALFLLVVVGTEVAGPSGPVADLRWVALGLAVLSVVIIAMGGRIGTIVRRRGVRSRAFDRLGGALDQMAAMGINPAGWLRMLGLALLNWVFDGAVLAACLLSIGVGVPWRDILIIYGLTQIAASLPFTPGGLGVVEGSLAALLIAYHVGPANALAGVIIYRAVSFWGFLPLGWAAWLGVSLTSRSAAAG